MQIMPQPAPVERVASEAAAAYQQPTDRHAESLVPRAVSEMQAPKDVGDRPASLPSEPRGRVDIRI